MTSCPLLKENWDVAAKKKNCYDVASRQQCSTAEKFKYHCVINSYRNETLEVCAHNLLIFGNIFIWFKNTPPFFFVIRVAHIYYCYMFCTPSCVLDRPKTFDHCVRKTTWEILVKFDKQHRMWRETLIMKFMNPIPGGL